MPPRPRHHGGDDEEPGVPRFRSAGESVRAHQTEATEAFRAGRPGNGDLITRSSSAPGGRAAGPPTRPRPGDDAEVLRSIEMENEGAVILAEHGYQVQQNPTLDEVAAARHATGDTGNPKSKPDYLIEGRVFDCYSPTKPNKSVRGIHSQVVEKVVTLQQTRRVVVNLTDWRGDVAALRRQFGDWPIEGLKELKVITPDGDVVQLDLPRGTD